MSVDTAVRDPGAEPPPHHDDPPLAPGGGPSHRRWTRSPLLRWSLVAVVVAFIANRAWDRRWMSDDGFIYLRVVRQIQAGNGPVFNQGERVEAATSPLWTWMLTVADWVTPLRLEWIAVLMGLVLTLVGVLAACGGAARLSARGPGEWWLPAGILVFAGLTPFWNFASSGLENGLVYAWLGAACFTLAGWARDDRRLSLPVAAGLGLGPLVRPELAIFSVAFVAAALAGDWRISTWGRRTAVVASALALPVAYQVFRMGYYAALVPNPAVAKEAGRSWWSQGWDYLTDLVGPYWLWVPLLLLAVTAYVPLLIDLHRRSARRAQLVVVAFGAAGLLDALYIVRVGGDFMPARLLLPAVFALVAPVAVVPLRKAFVGVLLVLPWTVVAAATLRLDSDDIRSFNRLLPNPIVIEDFGWGDTVTGTGTDAERQFFDGTGVYYGDRRLPAEPAPGRDPAVASYGVGIISYALGTDVYILDLLGLGDPFTAHLQLDERGIVAHEKPLPEPWIAARLTSEDSTLSDADFTKPPFYLSVPIDDPDGRPLAERTARAREALRCDELVEFVDTYTEPLSASRFVRNLGRSVANHGFRIAPEPRNAVTQLCP